jgi:hypothetical protein
MSGSLGKQEFEENVAFCIEQLQQVVEVKLLK